MARSVAKPLAARFATVRPHQHIAWWQWPHVLSLDAPIVALVWQRWWAQTLHVEMCWSHFCVLGLGVWLMYLADRLADAFRAEPGETVALRHSYHGRRRALLSVLLLPLLAALVAVASSGLSRSELRHGLLFLALATVYFWLIHGRREQSWTSLIPKEAAVGGLFAVGTVFFPWPQSARVPHELIGGVGLFGALCFCNCALITSWERHSRDVRDQSSLLNAFPRLTGELRTICVALGCLAGACSVWTGDLLFVPLSASGLALAALDYYRNRLSPNSLRIMADAVLLTPLLTGFVSIH